MRLARPLIASSAGPALLGLLGLASAGLMAPACSGSSAPGFNLQGSDAGGTSGFGIGSSSGGGVSGSSGASTGSGSGSTSLGGNVGGGDSGAEGDASTSVQTTIYAHTDDQLYSMDPQSKSVTLIGSFTGLGGGTGDTSITDLAVNAAGKVYVNSETVIYTAALPAGGTGSVALTKLAAIAGGSTQRFYALGFTPANALGAGTGEVLIGGDGNGELWSIDPTSGATKDVGGFGADPSVANATLALSGDVVFYMDSTGAPKGLATIRSCTTSSKGSATCDAPSDYLAGIDMTALASAYASGTPATTLNAGIYGSPSPSETGPGTGYPEVFGLGVWGGNVYGFTHGASGTSASLLSIATSGSTAGAGTVVPTNVSLSSGWAGAGVTTTVTVTVAPPPPPPTPK